MPLILSGSVNISGSMTATTILVSSPGGGGMVSSSQQIQNYNLFAVTSSANTFYGNQGISGSLNVTSATGTNVTPQLTVTNTTTNGYGIIRVVGAARGGLIDFYNTSSAQASIAANDGAIQFYTNGDSSGTADVTFTSAGNIALPNNSGNAGSGRVTFTNGNGVTWETGHSTSFNIFIFVYNGGTVAQINPSTGAYTALSDINKKKNIQLSTIGLNEVLQLKPSTFIMKNDETDVEQLGFIAQEVKDIIPQAYVENDGFIGLSDRPIIAALTKAMQEQQAIIDGLIARIEALENN
jgi:hypothetical protein